MEWTTVAAIVVIAVATLVLALVAATETALERANIARIQAAASRGDARAIDLVGTLEKPRDVLGPLTTARVMSAATVVSTFAYLGAREFEPLAGAGGFGLIGGVVIAAVQMTVGILAARTPEFTAMQFSPVVRATAWLFMIPAMILSLPARIVARSLQAVAPGPDDDFLALMEREEASGGVEEEEQRMIRGIIDLEDKTAREIMTPRIDVIACEADMSLSDVAGLATEHGLSRIPVYQDTIDNIVGVAYAKDLLAALANGDVPPLLSATWRSPVFIPESKRLDELLREMRATRTHLALVVDEYGGTAGLVTIEDLLEEIVGEIEDEYDVAQPPIEVLSENEVILDAGEDTDVLQNLFGYEAEGEDFDTVGGFLIDRLGRVPSVGDEVEVDELALRVLSMEGRRVRRVRVRRNTAEAPADDAATA